MKKLLVRGVFALGLVSGFGVGMAKSPSQPVQPEALVCDDYACNVKCKQAGYVEGWCNPECYCSEF
jgi:hypothetical protein